MMMHALHNALKDVVTECEPLAAQTATFMDDDQVQYQADAYKRMLKVLGTLIVQLGSVRQVATTDGPIGSIHAGGQLRPLNAIGRSQ